MAAGTAEIGVFHAEEIRAIGGDVPDKSRISFDTLCRGRIEDLAVGRDDGQLGGQRRADRASVDLENEFILRLRLECEEIDVARSVEVVARSSELAERSALASAIVMSGALMKPPRSRPLPPFAFPSTALGDAHADTARSETTSKCWSAVFIGRPFAVDRLPSGRPTGGRARQSSNCDKNGVMRLTLRWRRAAPRR